MQAIKRAPLLILPVVAMVLLSMSAAGQEGHPLKGVWYGDFRMGGQRHDLTVVMDWDGTNITGMVNPGPNSAPILAARLDVRNPPPLPEGQRGGGAGQGERLPRFQVYIVVDYPVGGGETMRITFDGEVQNPVPANRRLVGSWRGEGQSGDFQLRRN